MPQISPMKWMMLNLITQSSIVQIISFMSVKKNYSIKSSNFSILIHKMSWKW